MLAQRAASEGPRWRRVVGGSPDHLLGEEASLVQHGSAIVRRSASGEEYPSVHYLGVSCSDGLLQCDCAGRVMG